MLDVMATARFKKDMKLVLKRGLNAQRLWDVVTLLRQQQPLPDQYRDHSLTGDYAGFRECHIQPDWLLVYRVQQDVLILTLARTGTHSDLF